MYIRHNDIRCLKGKPTVAVVAIKTSNFEVNLTIARLYSCCCCTD